nr:WAP four-disulfide core domain protein 2-like [Anolis sagrei ordinatus]
MHTFQKGTMQSRLVLLALLVFWAGCSSASDGYGSKKVKPGVCPKRAPPGHTNPCKNPPCKTDACCPGKMKCCQISCGKTCLMPMSGIMERLAPKPTAARPTRKTLVTVTAPAAGSPTTSKAPKLEMEVAVPTGVPPAASLDSNPAMVAMPED